MLLAAGSSDLYSGKLQSASAGPNVTADGIVLIDQAAAEAGGVTANDAPGLPVTIAESGSYRLAGNLIVPDSYTTAIDITVPDVTLDLGGFTIAGPTVCSYGGSVTCTGQGDGVGVLVSLDGVWNSVTIKNGIIRGMGKWGILSDTGFPGLKVDSVTAVSHGEYGIEANSAIISRSTFVANGWAGIIGNANSLQDSAAFNNAGLGVWGQNSTGAGNNVLDGNGTNMGGGVLQTSSNTCGGILCP